MNRKLIGYTRQQLEDMQITAEVRRVMDAAKATVFQKAQQVYDYQAAFLYHAARQYNFPGANILEIGTFHGYSTYFIASATPEANVYTLNPHEWENEIARKALDPLGNVQVLCAYSWDMLETFDGPELDLIFVDGDHKQVRRDLWWWNWVAVGGSFLFHDYTPNQAQERRCPPVFRGLKAFNDWMGRPFDYMLTDDLGVGMVGYIKRLEDELYNGECD